MSRAKALPNRPLRKSLENRPPGFVRSEIVSELPLKKLELGWPEIASSQPGVAIPVKLAPVIIGMTMSVITMSAVIVRAVIRSIKRSGVIRIIVTVGVRSVKSRIAPDAEVNLSVRARRPRKRQYPSHDCNQQKFLHDLPPDNLTGDWVESFLVIRRPERSDTH